MIGFRFAKNHILDSKLDRKVVFFVEKSLSLIVTLLR